jgi:hypothetical protein
MNLRQHPLSAIFPALPDDELKALAADIKAHGLRSQIVLYKGEVLDGWHRYRACEMVGVKPRTIDYNGSDPKSFVKSANWHRRHLTASQRGFAEVQLSEWAPEGRPKTTGPFGPVKSTAAMADEAQVGINTIKRAKEVQVNGSETLKEAVKEGVIAIDKAAEIAKLPKEKQAKAMAEPTKKKAKPAKQGDDWKAKYDALLEDYNALKENRDDLADELKTCEAIRTGAEAVEMQKLRAEVKHCTRRRDELMASAHEMRKECTRWQERAKKAGWRPNK